VNWARIVTMSPFGRLEDVEGECSSAFRACYAGDLHSDAFVCSSRHGLNNNAIVADISRPEYTVIHYQPR